MTGKGLIEKAMELLSAPGHPYVPLALQFPLIDIDVVARQLDLVDKGKTRGAKGNPATDAAVFDDVEQRIVSVIGDAKTTAQAIYHDNLHSYEQRLAALDFKLFVTEIKGASLEVCGNYLTSVNEGKGRVIFTSPVRQFSNLTENSLTSNYSTG